MKLTDKKIKAALPSEMNSMCVELRHLINYPFGVLELLKDKVSFLTKFVTGEHKLSRNGMYGDAFTDTHINDLVFSGCVYIIDVLSQIQTKNGQSKQEFIDVLIQYGGEPLWAAIKPDTILEHLKKNKRSLEHLTKVSEFIESLQSQKRFFTSEEINELLKNDKSHQNLSQKDKSTIKKNMRYGSMAALVYDYIRIPAVHGLGAAPFIASEITFRDELIEVVMLRRVLYSFNKTSKEHLLEGINFLGLHNNQIKKLEEASGVTEEMIEEFIQMNINKSALIQTTKYRTLWQLFLLDSVQNIISSIPKQQPPHPKT